MTFNSQDKIKNASLDLRYLLNQNYRKKVALKFVANHYLLDKNCRNYLARSVFSDSVSQSRQSKLVNLEDIKDIILFLDGYNIIITVESILNSDKVVLADDGIIRDTQAVFGKYKFREITISALSLIFEGISIHRPKYIEFYLDKQVSFSGKLAQEIEAMMKNYDLNGRTILSNNVDYHLVKECSKSICIMGTSDGVIIDKVEKVVDIPHFILKNLKNE
ncbi:MAG: DUF434 domain-containing protein [Methanobacteriaceae archaeon]|nr:DUF434 domain-containing protein [Methanobacteriaceae archaeon]MDP2835883.1 DUF434 domain-containing protein [Methanobacteriaceae archaeon]MDP3034134.1 DUF434 domain-containing protein [Methanobacteriaceae archaeon]MDP3485917.1 DUF434 domain-containing protein [Methanobacteriaceae archaeon]MDP3623055.1 DUF434 domain-containing protein [Methanobacteriaceae archaeon]